MIIAGVENTVAWDSSPKQIVIVGSTIQVNSPIWPMFKPGFMLLRFVKSVSI
jgi:hypothetical protein